MCYQVQHHNTDNPISYIHYMLSIFRCNLAQEKKLWRMRVGFPNKHTCTYSSWEYITLDYIISLGSLRIACKMGTKIHTFLCNWYFCFNKQAIVNSWKKHLFTKFAINLSKSYRKHYSKNFVSVVAIQFSTIWHAPITIGYSLNLVKLSMKVKMLEIQLNLYASNLT